MCWVLPLKYLMGALSVLGTAPQTRGTANAGFNSLPSQICPPPRVPLVHSLEVARERCHKVPARGHYYDGYIVSGHNGGTLYEK